MTCCVCLRPGWRVESGSNHALCEDPDCRERYRLDRIAAEREWQEFAAEYRRLSARVIDDLFRMEQA